MTELEIADEQIKILRSEWHKLKNENLEQYKEIIRLRKERSYASEERDSMWRVLVHVADANPTESAVIEEAERFVLDKRNDPRHQENLMNYWLGDWRRKGDEHEG